MSENIKTENLQQTDEIQENEISESNDNAAENSQEVTSVFSKEGESTLGGTEYIGNFDDLLKSLGITPISQMDSAEVFADEGFEEIKLNIKQEDGYVPFSDETYLQSAQKEASAKQNKKFMQNFRVLSKKTNDSTILEATPTGEAKGNVADRIKLEEGEGLFDAVERAESLKKKGVFHAKGKSADRILDKANKKKKEEVLMKAKELSAVLQKKLAIQKIQLIVLGIIGFIMIIFSFLPSLYTAEESPLQVLFKDGAKVYGIINIALLMLTAGVGYDRLIASVKSVKDITFNSGTGLLVLFVAVLVHQIVLIIKGQTAFYDINLYNIYALFSVMVAILSESLKAKIALMNISVVVKSGVLDSIHAVENKADSEVLLKGVTNKGKALYCAQADTIRGLNGNLGVRPNENKFYTFLHIGVLVASLAAGAVIMIRSRNVSLFVTAIVACICLCG